MSSPHLTVFLAAFRATRPRQVRRQLDSGAVLPQTLQGVELPILVLQDVDDDVPIVHQHPVGVGETLTGPTLGPGTMHGLVDRVNDGVDVAFIRAGGQQEDVGQTESLGYVDSGEVLSLLIGRGASSGDSQIGSMFGGGARVLLRDGQSGICSSGDCTARAVLTRAGGSTPRPRQRRSWRCYWCPCSSAARPRPR